MFKIIAAVLVAQAIVSPVHMLGLWMSPLANGEACTDNNGSAGVGLSNTCVRLNQGVMRVNLADIDTLENLAPFKDLVSLTIVTTQGHSDLSGLPQLTSLTDLGVLMMENAPLTGVEQIAGLPNLELLVLDGLGAVDLSSLDEAEALVMMNVELSPFSNAPDDNFTVTLPELPGLTYFEANDVHVTNWDALTHAEALTELAVDQVPNFTMETLRGLTDLTDLSFDLSQMGGDVTLAPLAALSNLTGISVSGTVASLDLAALTGLPLTNLALGRSNRSGIDMALDLTPLSQLDGLTHFSTRGFTHDDLSPLAALPNLRSVRIEVAELPDLGMLVGFPALDNLELTGGFAGPAEGLVSLPPLSTLNIRANTAFDMTALAGLSSVDAIEIIGEGVGDLSALSSVAVRELTLNGTSTRDLGPLGETPGLEVLDVFDLPADDLTTLGSAEALRDLRLSRMTIGDLDFVRDVPLEKLRLTRVTAADISALTDITTLVEATAFILITDDYAPMSALHDPSVWYIGPRVRERMAAE